MKRPKSELLAFAAVAVLNLLSVALAFSTGEYLTKPLLMATLGLWYHVECRGRHTRSSLLLLAGLAFSLAGDVLLMLVSRANPEFFLFGLASFLLAHLCYIASFSQYPGWSRGYLLGKPWWTVLFVLYLVAFLFYLGGALAGLMRLAVPVYAAVITFMAMSALHLGGRMEQAAVRTLFAGALLFVISDSLIAIYKFKYPETAGAAFSLGIMVTYIAGQYLIVRGGRHLAA
jgi:uncharacterized membrane protein YhhN